MAFIWLSEKLINFVGVVLSHNFFHTEHFCRFDVSDCLQMIIFICNNKSHEWNRSTLSFQQHCYFKGTAAEQWQCSAVERCSRVWCNPIRSMNKLLKEVLEYSSNILLQKRNKKLTNSFQKIPKVRIDVKTFLTLHRKSGTIWGPPPPKKNSICWQNLAFY